MLIITGLQLVDNINIFYFSVDECKGWVYNLFSNSPGGETYISLWGSPEI